MNIHIFTIICLFQPSESMNLKVAGRVRPMTESENSKGSKRIVKAAGSNITIDASNKVDILSRDTYFLFLYRMMRNSFNSGAKFLIGFCFRIGCKKCK